MKDKNRDETQTYLAVDSKFRVSSEHISNTVESVLNSNWGGGNKHHNQ